MHRIPLITCLMACLRPACDGFFQMALQLACLIAGLMASLMAFLIAFEIDPLIIIAMRSSGCKGTLLRVFRRERRGAAYVDGCAACTRGGQGGGMGLEAQAGRCLVQVPSQVRRDYQWPKSRSTYTPLI